METHGIVVLITTLITLLAWRVWYHGSIRLVAQAPALPVLTP